MIGPVINGPTIFTWISSFQSFKFKILFEYLYHLIFLRSIGVKKFFSLFQSNKRTN